MRLNLKKFIGNILFASLILLIVGRFLSIVAGTPFPMSVIASHSMEPSLFKGDVLPWVPCSIDDVREGDIVIYKSATSWGKDVFVAHRVESIIVYDGKTELITKGDANNYTDQAGPHVPEPPINDRMLEGKAIMVGSQPLKIPFAGYPWLFIQTAFIELSKPMSWGKPQSDMHYIIFAPAAISFSILVAGVIIWAPENGKTMKEKLREHIFGPERISSKRIFFYILIFYLIFLMVAGSLSYDRMTASLGVGKAAPKSAISFGNMEEGEISFPRSLSVVNPSLFPVRGMVFASGNITPFIQYGNSIFTLKNGEKLSGNVTAYIPPGTDAGIYTGSIYIYSSPYWVVIPYGAVKFFYNQEPAKAVFILSAISAVIMTVISFIILLGISAILERYVLERRYLSWAMLPLHVKLHPLYSKIPSFNVGRKFADAFRWMNGELHWVDFRIEKPAIASLTSFVLIAPVYFYICRSLICLLFIASVAGGIVAYAIGCRWRAEIMFSALLTDGIFSIAFAGSSFVHIFGTNHSIFVPLSSAITIGGVILFIFAVMAVPACLLSWLPGYAIHYLREKKDYGVMLKRCDI